MFQCNWANAAEVQGGRGQRGSGKKVSNMMDREIEKDVAESRDGSVQLYKWDGVRESESWKGRGCGPEVGCLTSEVVCSSHNIGRSGEGSTAWKREVMAL